MTLWISMALMCLVAAGFIALPLYRDRKRLAPNTTLIVVVVLAAAAGLYAYQGNPDVPSGRSDPGHDMEELVASLEQRVTESPDDLNGWIMLGRTNLAMQKFGAAVTAFERAVELEGSSNAQTLVSLAESLLARDGSSLQGRPAALVESALALDPNNPQALFYTGINAANLGDTELAASRWEKLMGLNPPPEIRAILEQNIALWRGESVPPTAPAEPAPAPTVDAVPEDAIAVINVSADDATIADLGLAASVFVIARDPAQPSPPIAVTRLSVSDLPMAVGLGDGNSMVQGRMSSMFPEFEVVVRATKSGQPMAQPGDWYASTIVRPAEQSAVDLTIDQQVP